MFFITRLFIASLKLSVNILSQQTISATTPEASEIPFVEPKQQDQAEKNTEASPEKKSDIKNEINVPTGAPVETLKKQKVMRCF